VGAGAESGPSSPEFLCEQGDAPDGRLGGSEWALLHYPLVSLSPNMRSVSVLAAKTVSIRRDPTI